MLEKITGIFKQLSNDPRKKKSWQGTIGIAIFTLFVLSSVIVNQSVQALNQAAGNYGYYGGTYGYGGSSDSSRETSDQVPAAPTSFSSSVTSTTASLSWTAPTLTTDSTAISTGGGSIASYKFHYYTSSLSSCSGGTSSVPTSASTSLSGLTASTTYYVAICATDNNVNDSAALTGSFTTSATTGGGGTSGAVVGGTITTPAPTVTTPVVTTPTVTTPAVTGPSIPSSVVANAAQLAAQLGVKQDTKAEVANNTKVTNSAKEFKVTLSAEVKTVVTNFVTYGTSSAAIKLGSGERLALVRDALDTLGSMANNSEKLLTFLEQTANGQKPTIRNLTKEVAQAGIARDMFKKLTGKSVPDFKNAKDDLAWNTILYRIRFARDLVKEKVGIVKFKAVFGKNPKSPLDWAVVRAWGYALK